MTNRWVPAIAVAVVTIVSGLLMAPAGAATTVSSSLRAELLSLREMPVGWSVVGGGSWNVTSRGASDPTSGLPGCFDKAIDLIVAHPIAAVGVGFTYGGALPAVVEALVQQRAASKMFASVASVCKTGQMSFPSFSDSSAAYSASGGMVVADMLVMRKGSVLMVLVEEGSPLVGGIPSVSQFEHFARLAASKVH